MKSCRICGIEKENEFFVKNKTFKSGIDTICLDCSREKVKLWRAKGKRNTTAESKKWYDKYPEKGRFKQSKYRAKKLNATPSWADLEKIKEIYQSCPVGYHVDHIIPLQNKYVCGLHVAENLQYLPAKLNLIKGNDFNGTGKHATTK